MFSLLTVFALSAVLAMPSYSQEFLYGPQNPPPKDASITFTGTANDGLIGQVDGKVYTIQNVTLANSTTVYWTILADVVKLSMNGSTYDGAENMTIDAGLSNLPGGIVGWSGNTSILVWDIPSQGWIYEYLDSKFIMTVTALDNSPIALVSPSITGIDAESGGAVLITGNDMVFKVKMEMFVSDDNKASYSPHLVYYDAAHTQDGAEAAYSSFDFGFYWENDPPEITTKISVNVDEGDTVTITNVELVAEDVESALEDIKFIIDPLSEGLWPANGKLLFNELDITLPDTFSMVDINAGTISYVHDGSETLNDRILLLLFDSDGARYMIGEDSVFSLILNITPVDDPPAVEVNSGATIDEDSSLILTANMLLTTDAESTSSLITYTLDPESSSDFPENGLLKLNDIPLSDGGTFTQDDINNGNLVYTHDGSETLSDGFQFRVADEFGHLATNNENPDFFFAITITPVNDAPLLTKNVSLVVEEGSSGVISNAFIAASDAESDAADITFTLDPDFTIAEPTSGDVLLDGVVMEDGESFTMADVNNNLVSFRHDGGEESNDFFGFNVSDPQGGIAHDGDYTVFHFNITITPVNDDPTLANPIADQETRAEQLYSFTFPDNTFEDVDPGDQFTYSSTLGDQTNLPDWLTFDGTSRTFSGTPQVADKGTITIMLKAVDMGMVEVTDNFDLKVISPVGFSNAFNNSGISVYPNPFVNEFNISVSDKFSSSVTIRVLNILGEEILEFTDYPGSTRSVDFEGKPAGIYFIRVEDGNQVQSLKLVKQ